MKVNGPLLSLGASGQIADAIVYRTDKGRNVVSSKAWPTDTKSSAQLAQRTALQSVAWAWRMILVSEDVRWAWHRASTVARFKGSGYHFWMHNGIDLYAISPTAGIVSLSTAYDPRGVRFFVKNLADGFASTEVGNFNILAGTTPATLALAESLPLVDGVVWSSPIGVGGETVFVQLEKDGIPRSGIHKITLIDGGGMTTTFLDNLHIYGDAAIDGTATGFGGLADRGDPAAQDFTEPDFATNGTWQDLDLSAIVPAGMTKVFLGCEFRRNAVGDRITFRKKGNANVINILRGIVVVAQEDHYFTGWVSLDANREVEYKISNGAWIKINLNVRGWL